MDLKQLSYFVAVADEGSFTGAARKLYMSQPPLSAKVRQLEEEMGCELLSRGKRNVTLTDSGRLMYRYAVNLLDISKVAKEEVMASSDKDRATIRVGIVSSLLCSSEPERIASYAKKNPSVRFEIIEGNTYELIEKIRAETVHFAMIRTPFKSDGLRCEKIFSDAIVACGTKSCLCSDSITLTELASLPLIVYKRWESILSGAFREKELSPDFRISCTDARTALDFASRGVGVALVPKSATSFAHTDNLVFSDIGDCTIRSEVTLVCKDGAGIPQCSLDFMKYMKTQNNILKQ